MSAIALCSQDIDCRIQIKLYRNLKHILDTNKCVHQCFCSPLCAGIYVCEWVHAYLEGSHAELNTEAQINVEVVGQKIEEHVVGAKQRDEEEGGLSQAPVGQKEGGWGGGRVYPPSHIKTC